MAESVSSASMRIAAAGIGAAVGGPIGAAIGGLLGAAVDPSGELVRRYVETFGEKAAEKFAEVGGDSLAKKEPPPLEAAHRKALSKTLSEIQQRVRWDGFDDWFRNWLRCLDSRMALSLGELRPDQLAPAELFQKTMERLDAQGAAVQRKATPSLNLEYRTMPRALLSAMTASLPDVFLEKFTSLIVKPEYEAAYKEAQLLFQRVTADKLESIDETAHLTKRTVDQIKSMVEQVLNEQRARSAVERNDTLPEAEDPTRVVWRPGWAPRKIVEEPRFEGQASLAELTKGKTVIVRFAGKPSKDWCDPRVRFVALYEGQPAVTRPIQPSWNRSVAGSSPEEWGGWPLCIPSFEIPVEWRVESYVDSKPWGETKRKAVQQFLDKCSQKYIECSVISLKKSEGKRRLFVHSADYDAFLHTEWAYYKGLEEALARGEYYRRRIRPEALDQLARRLASDNRFRELIPKRYRDRFEQREIDAQDVYLTLDSIIQREAKALEARDARRMQEAKAR